MTRIRNQRGFSLLEAIIAMSLLSVGLLAAGLLQIGSIKANVNAAGRTLGVSLAQSTMEWLRSLPLDDGALSDNGGLGLNDGMAPAGGGPIPTNADQMAGVNGQVTASDGRVYTVFWNVEENLPVSGTKTVRLFVYWNDQKTGLNKVVMTSVLGEYYL